MLIFKEKRGGGSSSNAAAAAAAGSTSALFISGVKRTIRVTGGLKLVKSRAETPGQSLQSVMFERACIRCASTRPAGRVRARVGSADGARLACVHTWHAPRLLLHHIFVFAGESQPAGRFLRRGGAESPE